MYQFVAAVFTAIVLMGMALGELVSHNRFKWNYLGPYAMGVVTGLALGYIAIAWSAYETTGSFS